MLQIDVGIIRQIDLNSFVVTLRSDGIISVNITSNEDIDVEYAKQIIQSIGQIGDEKKYPILVVVNEFIVPTPEARNYLARAESNPYGTAAAYVIQSFPQKIVGNFYLSYNKPARPTKLFNSEEKAVEWLLNFCKK